VEGLQAIAGGQVDFAFGFDFAVINTLSEQLSVLGSVAAPPAGFHKLVFTDGITDPADLAGRRVGVITGTAQEYVTTKWIEANGLTDVELVPVPGAFELVAALKTGDIQAGFVFGPGLAEVHGDDSLSIVGDDSSVLDVQGMYLLGDAETAADAELVTRLLTALEHANEDIVADPRAAAAMVADANGGDPAAIEAVLTTLNPGVGMSRAQLDNLLDIQRYLIESGHIDANTDVEASLNLDALRGVAPDKVTV
jgi:NitT/TauT family transport system substrate-binding protein